MASQRTLALTQRTKYLFVLCISFLPIFSLMVAIFITSFRPLFINLESIVEKSLREIRPIHKLQMSLVNAVLPPNTYLVHGSPRELKAWKTSKQKVEAAFEKVLHTSHLTSDKKIFSELREEWRTATREGDRLFTDGSQTAPARLMVDEIEKFDTHIASITLRLNDVIDTMEQECFEHYNQIHRHKLLGLIMSLGAVFTGFFLGLAGAVWLTRDRQQMEIRSLSDPLTGILNRRALENELNRLHRDWKAKRISTYTLLMMDMDNFKLLNDTYGHPAGDLVLQQFVRKTRESIRGNDIFGRFGGEEFLLILPDTHRQEAFAMAERIRKAISHTPVSIPDTEKQILMTVSIGQATLPADAPDPEGLIRAADTAMYQAKTGGKNQVACSRKDRLSIRKET